VRVSRWCEGAQTKAKRRIGSRPNFRKITLAFQTLSRLEAIRGPKSTNGGESVSQPSLKDKALSTFVDQNPPIQLRANMKIRARKPPIKTGRLYVPVRDHWKYMGRLRGQNPHPLPQEAALPGKSERPQRR